MQQIILHIKLSNKKLKYLLITFQSLIARKITKKPKAYMDKLTANYQVLPNQSQSVLSGFAISPSPQL